MKRNLPLSYEDVQIALLSDNHFLHSSLMVRTEAMRKIGGYDEKYVYSSDYDLLSRLALSGKIENLPDILMMYRLHDTQISQLYKKEQKGYADEIRRKYQIEFVNRYKSAGQLAPDVCILIWGELLLCILMLVTQESLGMNSLLSSCWIIYLKRWQSFRLLDWNKHYVASGVD